MITIRRQLELLWEHVCNADGTPKTVTEVAQCTDVSEQSILNLLHGRTHDPRLDTLRQLSRCFGISLDYFNLPTESACLDYLVQTGKAGSAPHVLQSINTHAQQLTPEKSYAVLSMLSWRKSAATL